MAPEKPADSQGPGQSRPGDPTATAMADPIKETLEAIRKSYANVLAELQKVLDQQKDRP